MVTPSKELANKSHEEQVEAVVAALEYKLPPEPTVFQVDLKAPLTAKWQQMGANVGRKGLFPYTP